MDIATIAGLVLALVGLIGGFGLGMVNAFKKQPSPALILLYGVFEGLLLGAISNWYNAYAVGSGWEGIVLQAVIATMTTFGVMLTLYLTGVVKVTKRFASILMVAAVTYLLIGLASLVPQLLKTWRTRSAGDLSLAWLVLQVVAYGFGFAYVLMLDAWASIFGHIVGGSLTVGLLLLIWLGLTRLIQAFQASHHISAQYPILDSLAYYLAGFGLVVALAYLMPAVSILVAGFFLDDAAEIVERTDFPDEVPGRAMPLGQAMLYALRFAALALAVNLAALALLLVPGINVAAFFLANTYLLGREYFELAAARFRPLSEAGAMRRHHTATVMLATCAASLLPAIASSASLL